MSNQLIPYEQRVPCQETFEQTLKIFEERQITAVGVANVPEDARWGNTCASYPGMLRTFRISHFSWHHLASPRQACQFLTETSGRVYHGHKLQAEGFSTLGPFGFDQLMEDFQKAFEEKGYVLRAREP